MKKSLRLAAGLAGGVVCAAGLGFGALVARYPRTDLQILVPGWWGYRRYRFSSMQELLDSKFTVPAAHDVPLQDHPKIATDRVMIEGPAGPMPLYIYRAKEPVGPVNPAGATALYWCHGGGYARGTASTEARNVADYVLSTNTVVVAPEYRTSAQAPFPAAFEDAYAGLLWLRDNAESVGANPSQIFVGGMSAGGGLAVALALKARDTGDVAVAFQLPLYPMLDDRMESASMVGNRELCWNEGLSRIAWELYLGELFGSDDVPAYAAPARATSWEGMPPAYTFIGMLDPFLDETLDFVEGLQEAGVEVAYDLYEGGFHNFDAFGWSQLGATARAHCKAAYRDAVERHFADQPSR